LKNNPGLYFDIWRKKDFKSLIMAYTQTAYRFKTEEEMRKGFAEMLDKYVEGGRSKYTGTKKQWSSAYTLGRELGIFRRKIGESYELSRLAIDFLESRILASEYLLNYLLNLNQLIDGKVIHPLWEVLCSILKNDGIITKNDVKNIEDFKLCNRSKENQRQIINVFFHRMVEAGILESSSKKDVYRLTTQYTLVDLMENCIPYKKTPEEFEKMDHEAYVDMISFPNPLINVYKKEI